MILTGIKVLDMAKAVAGPHCAQLLADMGADVTKIEMPRGGDDTRSFKPALDNELSAYFIANNRNKKSVTLNLKEPAAIEILKKMLGDTDVLIESMVTGAMDRLGLSYEEVRKINPRIIYCSVSGYGRTGPWAKKGGYELMAQAFSGMISMNASGPDAPRCRTAYPVTDVGTSMNAAIAILGALFHRERTGEGQFVEVNLLSTQLAYANAFLSQYSFLHVDPQPQGFKHPNLCPYSDYQAKDGRLIIGMSNEKQWKQFCSDPHFAFLAENPHFMDQASRRQNEPELQAAMESVFKDMTVAELAELLDGMKIACAPFNTVGKLFEYDYIRDEMLVKLSSPKHEDVYAAKAPFRFGIGEMDYHRYYLPELGEHTDEALEALGYCADEIQNLRAQGII